MRTIAVSVDVFAKIWELRKTGENTEDEILRRVLGVKFKRPPGPKSRPGGPVSEGGVYDRRFNVFFPEGFKIFRTYLNQPRFAIAGNGVWLLGEEGEAFKSLNGLSRAIGATSENAWINWFYKTPGGEKKPVDALRDRARIKRLAGPAKKPEKTWGEDVRQGLENLGGEAPLPEIYREVEKIRQQAGRSTPRTLEATIRRALEDHSSDSRNYRGHADLFYMVKGKRRGTWGLR